MQKLISTICRTFKKDPSIWLFYAFLVTIPFSIRKVVYFLPINNSFNEYTGAYIYLSDILLILTFIFTILYNINSILSMIRAYSANILKIYDLFHVEHNEFNYVYAKKIKSKIFTYILFVQRKFTKSFVPRGTNIPKSKTYTHIVNLFIKLFPLYIGFFSFISILWTTNPQIALYRSIKLAEVILLYYFIIYIVPRGTIINIHYFLNNLFSKLFHVEHKKILPEKAKLILAQRKLFVPRGTNLLNILYILILITTLNSIIAIFQFAAQKSVGLFWLKEAKISPELSGIAKIIIDNEAYIRSYGLLPHPNILGGFLVFSIIFSIMFSKLFHVEHNSKNNASFLNKNCSTWNNLCTFIKYKLFSWKTIITIQGIALIFTFSKSALISLFIGLLYINKRESKKLFHVEQSHWKLYSIIVSLLLLNSLHHVNYHSLLIKSLQERILYLAISVNIIEEYPIVGIGVGQFVPYLSNKFKLLDWQYQPVHNIFMLFANEYGIILLFAFIMFLHLLLQDNYCSTWNNNETNANLNNKIALYAKGVLMSFVFIMLFDHYFWDIQQGQILLWLLLGIILNTKHTSK